MFWFQFDTQNQNDQESQFQSHLFAWKFYKNKFLNRYRTRKKVRHRTMCPFGDIAIPASFYSAPRFSKKIPMALKATHSPVSVKYLLFILTYIPNVDVSIMFVCWWVSVVEVIFRVWVVESDKATDWSLVWLVWLWRFQILKIILQETD